MLIPPFVENPPTMELKTLNGPFKNPLPALSSRGSEIEHHVRTIIDAAKLNGANFFQTNSTSWPESPHPSLKIWDG
jgi:hypothetical protein